MKGETNQIPPSKPMVCISELKLQQAVIVFYIEL